MSKIQYLSVTSIDSMISVDRFLDSKIEEKIMYIYRIYSLLTHYVGDLLVFSGLWNLTHNRPAMPFGNRKIYFKRSFHFSIVTT